MAFVLKSPADPRRGKGGGGFLGERMQIGLTQVIHKAHSLLDLRAGKRLGQTAAMGH